MEILDNDKVIKAIKTNVDAQAFALIDLRNGINSELMVHLQSLPKFYDAVPILLYGQENYIDYTSTGLGSKPFIVTRHKLSIIDALQILSKHEPLSYRATIYDNDKDKSLYFALNHNVDLVSSTSGLAQVKDYEQNYAEIFEDLSLTEPICYIYKLINELDSCSK